MNSFGEIRTCLVILFSAFFIVKTRARFIYTSDHCLEANNKTSPCTTPGCVRAAYHLLENMDQSVNPCDDFYSFACGGFNKEAFIPDDKAELTLISSLTDKLHLQVRRMIEDLREESSSSSSRMVKDLYDSCSSHVLERMAPLESLVSRLGGWPVVEGERWRMDMDPSFKWTDLVLRMKEEGIAAAGGFLVGVGVGSDLKSLSGGRIVVIGEPQLSFGREELANPVFMSAYQKYQFDLAVFLGAANTRQSFNEMSAVLQFERNLANISLPREAARLTHPLKFYNPMTITQLQERFPPLDWLHFIKSSLPEGLDITEEEVVSVNVPLNLHNLLRLIEMTDQRTIVNYLMWRAVASTVPYTSERAKEMKLEFTAKVTGQLQRPPKWRECVALVTTALGHAVGKLYVGKYFDEKSREEAVRLFEGIHEEFGGVLEEAEWMDGGTRLHAHEKAKAMKSHIAYPKELLDDSKILELYKGLQLSPDDLMGNMLNISKAAMMYSLSRLRDAVDPNDWVGHGKPAMVNAFYSPMRNVIQFPAGILQGHFFAYDRPHYMNFGSIGWVYGHELIHGFDDTGRHFDLKGDLKDWWHPTTKQHYNEKTKCMVDQYSKLGVPDPVTNTTTTLNGIISLGENIADNGGIKLAYRAYRKWESLNPPEKRLPGLSYSPSQLFWITAANNWCSKYRSIALHHIMKTGVHPPGNFRVLGSFSNSKEFARDFSCSLGSPMNPERKCDVW